MQNNADNMGAVTQWFFIYVNPVNEGKYEVRFHLGAGKFTEPEKLYFRNGRWEHTSDDRLPWGSFGDQWRGLADKPIRVTNK